LKKWLNVPLTLPPTVQMESIVSAPVAGKVKRILVAAGDSISQQDLITEIVHG
jgi:biotin carboxyl carrier protein